MSKAPARIATSRLVLRRPELEDADRIYTRYAADAHVTRYLSWPRHASASETRAFLVFCDEEWERWPAGPYLFETTKGELLGGTGFTFESQTHAAIGYVLARDAWGRGYATEALRTLQGLGHELALQQMTAQCHSDNLASRRVLERCGFVRQDLHNRAQFPNLLPGVEMDVLSYAYRP